MSDMTVELHFRQERDRTRRFENSRDGAAPTANADHAQQYFELFRRNLCRMRIAHRLLRSSHGGVGFKADADVVLVVGPALPWRAGAHRGPEQYKSQKGWQCGKAAARCGYSHVNWIPQIRSVP